MSELRQHSEAAWRIASPYSDILASETRDLAAAIDVELASLRAQLASMSRELSDTKSSVSRLSEAAETAFRDRDYYSTKLVIAEEALKHVRGIIVEAAMVGFNYKEGDWADRLFASQHMTKAALSGSGDHSNKD